jgi:hypothetical protein
MARRSIVKSRTNELKRSVADCPAASVTAESALDPVGSAPSTISELLTPRECADYRRCSLRTLDRERAELRGPPYAQIGPRIFYRRKDVDLFIAGHLRMPRVADIDDKSTPRPNSRSSKIAGSVGDESDTSPRRRTLPGQPDETGELEEAETLATVLAQPRAKSSPAKRVQR